MSDYRSVPLPSSLRLNNETVAPYFQPIIALETGKITGYEVLGRAVGDTSLRSLGPFFGDESIPTEDHLMVDRMVREQAIEMLGRVQGPPQLFFNLKPGWIYQNSESGELYTLTLLDRYGVDPRRVVIEITEESFQGSIEVLRSVVDRYRARGCQIAIDDVGKGFSNADRIAQIQPDLLKIDMHIVKKSGTHHGYFGVLRSFSDLAEQIGASLLYEGVETKEDLERAIQSGARYVQGFYFAKAVPDFQPEDSFSGLVKTELARHMKQYVMSEKRWHEQAERLGARLQRIVQRADLDGETDDWLERLLPELDESCMRVYVCDEDGIQLSANYSRGKEAGWSREEQFRYANWSWRPYFVPNTVQLSEHRRSIVSRTYTDLDTRERVRTILVFVQSGLILFADIRNAGSRAEGGDQA